MAPLRLFCLFCLLGSSAFATEVRPPRDDGDLRSWLENMIWHHRYNHEEAAEVLGMKPEAVRAAVMRFGITPERKPKRAADAGLLVLPYPGGRHPRIGFLDGAVEPQRETKVSVFTPWDEQSYVVIDVPEAIWSNLGLTYLAHTHVPTVWTKRNETLRKLEWQRRPDGALVCERTLPNGIAFGTLVHPGKDGVRMEMWLFNGTNQQLSDLRVQMCVMLKGAVGFTQQSNDNKLFLPPYAAARSKEGNRWIITAWEPLQRTWGNPPCPCIHADPKFPDCAPGQTQRVHGWLSFYQGDNLKAELARLDKVRERPAARKAVKLTGTIVDDASGKALPARVYLQDEAGGWHFPSSASKDGSAVYYRKQRQGPRVSAEMHTTLSAHPFAIDLPPGKYTITAERGKEYLPEVRTVTVDEKPVEVTLRLRRWVDMAKLGWYSGETHVHRTLEELPNAMLADDLNVALPLTHWVTEAFEAPRREGSTAKLIEVDGFHVIWPRNTEYEIFRVNKKPHTLGAFFVLNHRTVFDRGVPPVKGIAEQAHQEGGLIEMDKHNWPWSMMLVPVMKPDLYELSNNHVWRTEFGFPTFGEAAAEYMQVERDRHGFTERGWLEYGFQNYYTLLNCGFRLRPTAGTASGVHPVPLGFGRVYVHCPEGFSYERWLKGLNAGHSFVTTGPMLTVQVKGAGGAARVTGRAVSGQELRSVEILVNGAVVKRLGKGREVTLDETVHIEGSSWVAVRCFEENKGRVRFAHSAPVHLDVEGKPLRPRKAEVEYLISRVADQLKRSKDVLPAEALKEYEAALEAYRKIAEHARPH